MENKQNIKLTPQQQEWQRALMQKSEDELRVILNEEDIYGPEFLRFAREELTGRVTGKRRRKTGEEIREEEEQQRREEEERWRQEEEEQQRLVAERAAEAARREEQNRKLAKRAGIIAAIVVIVGIGIGLIVWNNTDKRLLVRGRNALADGDKEKAEKFFERAAETNGDAAFELWKIKKTAYYLKKAADYYNLVACGLYGEILMKSKSYAEAIPYLKKALLASAIDPQHEKYRLLGNYLHYLLGCAHWGSRNWNEARDEFINAVNGGYTEAKVRLGDWYLCRGELHDYQKAIECYENAPANWPGVKEKRQVLRDLKKYERNFSSDNWSNMRFYGEHSYWEQKSVRRGIAKNKETGYRFLGRFNPKSVLLSGLGIIANEDGSIYVGNIKVNSTKSGYTPSYSGKGSFTDSFSGAISTGQWKNNSLVGSSTVTDIFGHTETVMR